MKISTQYEKKNINWLNKKRFKPRQNLHHNIMYMLWFKFILGLTFFELVSILFAIVPDYGYEYTTKGNKNWTSFENFAPKLNLNHNIYLSHSLSFYRNKINFFSLSTHPLLQTKRYCKHQDENDTCGFCHCVPDFKRNWQVPGRYMCNKRLVKENE